ncbi:unnamed protein product [Linum trigynum]|uniref:Aminotransferase-like plant mobile domain-containing protein n=1 Tax=Linum trigynum TaxID=586398 RepID=A0AAV2D7R2_9ROSI
MLRHFMRLDIDNDLLTAMAERWRPELHTFHFPEGEMTITLKDVAILTGLPITGDAIIDKSRKPEDGWGPLIQERLGFNMPTTTPVDGVGHPPLNARQVSILWLVDHIQMEVNIGPDTPEDQVERYARVYLIGLVGGFLFPDKSNRWIQGMWLHMLLGDWDEIGKKKLGVGRLGWDLPRVVYLLEVGSETSWWCDVHTPTLGMGASSVFSTSRPSRILVAR